MDNLKMQYLLDLGYDTAWYYQHVQSGEIKYSIFDPMDLHWSEREMYFTKEVKLQDVPTHGILQLEI